MQNEFVSRDLQSNNFISPKPFSLWAKGFWAKSEQMYQKRGRIIDQQDLNTIRMVITSHWEKGRSAFSRTLCRQWNWNQANGSLKDRACRVMLLKLEEKGEICLPPRLKESYRHPKKVDRLEYICNNSPLSGTVSEFGSLTIKMVRPRGGAGCSISDTGFSTGFPHSFLALLNRWESRGNSCRIEYADTFWRRASLNLATI